MNYPTFFFLIANEWNLFLFHFIGPWDLPISAFPISCLCPGTVLGSHPRAIPAGAGAPSPWWSNWAWEGSSPACSQSTPRAHHFEHFVPFQSMWESLKHESSPGRLRFLSLQRREPCGAGWDSLTGSSSWPALSWQESCSWASLCCLSHWETLYSSFCFNKKRENPSSAAAHFLLEQQLRVCYRLLMSFSTESGVQVPGEGNKNPKFAIFFSLLASLKHDSSAPPELKWPLLASQRLYFCCWAGCQPHPGTQ